MGNFPLVLHELRVWDHFRFPAFGLGCSVHMKYLHDCFVCQVMKATELVTEPDRGTSDLSSVC